MTTPSVGHDGVDPKGSEDSARGGVGGSDAGPAVGARQARIGPYGRRVASRVGWSALGLAVATAGAAIFINPTPNQGSADASSSSAFVPASCPPGMSTNTCQNLRLKALEDNAVGVAPSSSPSPSPTPTVTVTASPTPSVTPTQAPTPSPTPTVTPTPTPPPSGFPGLSNTGVPAGTALGASGSLTISTAGTVVDGKDIRGTVNINASNVTLKRSRVTASSFSVIRIKEGVTGVRIEDVTVDGLGTTSGANCIWGPVTVVRANVTGCENGFVGSSNSTLQDSWLHGLNAPGSPHIDGVQEDGGISNVKILHNTIEMSSGAVSAVMVDNYFGAARDITVDGNRLLGGQYTVYSDGSFNSNAMTGISFTSNRMAAGNYGYSLIRGSGAAGVVWTGNVNDATGAPISK